SQWFSWFSTSRKRKEDINEADGELNNVHPTTETLLDEKERSRIEENEKKGKKEKTKMVGPISVFRYADGLDIFFMIIGSLGALGNGLCLPLMHIVFGEMTDSILCHNTSLQNSSECAKFKPIEEQMTVFSLYYVAI
ncbi:unnamed protein product, partial [Staurois parvus]